MSFILAIEPDPRQSERLADLVRRRLHADLVHAPTTEGALAALAKVGDRVPDLVLVPSLLSAHEDAAIAGALRVIAAAANVRMLTIPMLADPEPPAKPQGMLARLRGKKPKVAPGGCDPEVFAEQIATYLAEAAAERKAKREEMEELQATAPARQAVPPPAPTPEPQLAPEPVIEPEPIVAPDPIFVPQQTYKPLIIQPVVIAEPDPVVASAEVTTPIPEVAFPIVDSWPDRSGDAMREIASMAEPAPVMDAPIVAAVGESVILPAEPLNAVEPMALETPVVDTPSLEVPVAAAPAPEPEPLFVASVSPISAETIVVAPEPIVVTPEPIVVAPEPVVVTPEPPVAETELAVAALLQSLAAPTEVTPPVVAADAPPAPVAEVAAPQPVVEPRADEVKARFWGSRIRIPKAVTKLVEPKAVETKSVEAPVDVPAEPPAAAIAAPEPIAEVVVAAVAPPEPIADVFVAAVATPEPIVEAPAEPAAAQDAQPVPATAAAPEPVVAQVEEPTLVEEPKIKASKSRIRIPKQSAVRKVAKPKPAPREEREEIDVDALIAPLLTEMAAKRTTPEPKSEPQSEPLPAPVAEHVPVAEPVLAMAAPTDEIDPMFFADDAMIVPPPTPAQAERSAWIELVESLRQDIERLKAEREQVAAPPPPPQVKEKPQSVVAKTMSSIRRRPAAPVVQMPSPAARAARTKPGRPVQDQWGLFDPEQCGFAALLAKLDEIGSREEASA